ncbi:MAG: hypothetical protein SNG49_06000 [Rikenellaceae bacterium]
MKAVKSIRFSNEEFADQATKRGTKLTPNKKSGKDRHHLYRSLEGDDEDDLDDFTLKTRESALDFFDDGEVDDDDDLLDDDEE